MSEISDKIQEKCLAFGDRIVKLNDYLLKEAANKKAEVRWLMEDGKKKKVIVKPVPVYLQSVANICKDQGTVL